MSVLDQRATLRAADAVDPVLEQTWADPPGFWGWFRNTDHKAIGRRYIVTAFIWFLLAGLLAMAMRLQLAVPENRLLSPDRYNQFFTTHGTAMLFLFAVPITQGFGIYFVPLMIGTRNIAFPRMNAFGYYCFLAGGLFLFGGLAVNAGPDMGWFAYPPLSLSEYTPGKRADIWAQMITLTEIAALIGAIEIITTAFKLRAPGMSLNRVPLFVWAMIVQSFAVIFALPAIVLSSTMLATDRLVHTKFFASEGNGDVLLWQHLFWFFGHPEVYLILIPALGMVSSVLAPFTRQRVFGYTALVLSIVATGFVGFGLWVHHMFATGLPQMGESFFTAASMLIAIPSGIQVFCWIVTVWRGRPIFGTPFLFVLGFLFTFVMGGLTGVMVASVPFDTQVHDTYFVVAHFHYTLIGGAVFPLFAAVYYWFPKLFGPVLREGLGKLHFGLWFAGFHLTFFPMHHLGLLGMPRRVYTYQPELGWNGLNQTASVGAGLMFLSICVFLLNLWLSLRRDAPAGNDPWQADTLEWSVASPPPPYNFARIPVVEGREALWDRSPEQPVVHGLRSDCHQVLVTTMLDAEPDHRHDLPGPSLYPFLLGIVAGAGAVGIIFNEWALPIIVFFSFLVLVGWFWEGQGNKPKPKES